MKIIEIISNLKQKSSDSEGIIDYNRNMICLFGKEQAK